MSHTDSTMPAGQAFAYAVMLTLALVLASGIVVVLLAAFGGAS